MGLAERLTLPLFRFANRFFATLLLLNIGLVSLPSHARAPEVCTEAKSDLDLIDQMIDGDKQLRNKDGEYIRELLSRFLDDPPSMSKLTEGALLLDAIERQGKKPTPAILRIVGSTAIVTAGEYKIGRATEWNSIYCRAVVDFPEIGEAYREFSKDSVAGDTAAVQILTNNTKFHPLKSYLTARIFLHTYTHREYVYARQNVYLDEGLDRLIEAFGHGIVIGELLPNFYVNRIRSCLSESQLELLEKRGIQFSWGTEYLRDYDTILEVAPQCKRFLDKALHAKKLISLSMEKKQKSEYSFGTHAREVVDILRGEGGSQYYKNSTYGLCTIARNLLFKASLAGDEKSIDLFLELVAEDDPNFSRAYRYFMRAVPDDEKISSCLKRDDAQERELLLKLYNEGKANNARALRLADLLYNSDSYSEAGSIMFSIAKRYKDAGNMSMVFRIYDVMKSRERLRDSVFARRVESLLE